MKDQHRAAFGKDCDVRLDDQIANVDIFLHRIQRMRHQLFKPDQVFTVD